MNAHRKYKFILAMCVVFLFTLPIFANNGITGDSIPYWKRALSIHTNVVDWAIVTPNIGVGFDVVNTPKEKVSLLLSGKYNWNSYMRFNPRYVYNNTSLKI